MIKNWAFKQKLELWKTYICHPELDGLSSDETGGAVNKCDCLDVV